MSPFLHRLIVMMVLCAFAHSATIQNYRAVFIPVYLHGTQTLLFAIRAFEDKNGQTQFLTVNANTLTTQLIDNRALDYRKISSQDNNYITNPAFQTTPYLRALNTYTNPPYALENQGLQQSENPIKNSAFMTVDLCPSTHLFEQDFFRRFITASSPASQDGTPIAISISGLWLLAHHKDFEWLIQERKSKKLDITWINHSYTHIYFPNVPFNNNFLNWKNTQIDDEFLKVERLLLSYGETPSVFVRMPGLVSNEKVIQHTKKLGLIPVGTNAWLAKNQPVKNGSIILVHGNGNEPSGIKRALPLLTQWKWLGMSQAISTPANNLTIPVQH